MAKQTKTQAANINDDEEVREAQATLERIAGRTRALETEQRSAQTALAVADTVAVAVLLDEAEVEEHRPLESIGRDLRVATEAERVARERLASTRTRAVRRVRQALDAERAEVLSGLADALRGLRTAMDRRRAFIDKAERATEADGWSGCEQAPWAGSAFHVTPHPEQWTLETVDRWLAEFEKSGFHTA